MDKTTIMLLVGASFKDKDRSRREVGGGRCLATSSF